LIDTYSLQCLIKDNIEYLCQRNFPHGKKVGSDWCVADLSGSPGNSLKIQLRGRYAGWWRDWASDQYGDFIELLKVKHGVGFRHAVQIIDDQLGGRL
jgi:twinkle protein